MIRRLARTILASVITSDGVMMMLNSQDYVENAKTTNQNLRKFLPPQAKPYIPSDPEESVRIIGTTKIISSALLALNKFPRLSAAVLTLTQIPTLLHRHNFWKATSVTEKENKRRGFLTALTVLSALLITTADGAGRPSMSWRAKKANKKMQKSVAELKNNVEKKLG